MTKKSSTKRKRMPRHIIEGVVTWRDLGYPPKYNKKGKVVGKNTEHGKRLQVGVAIDDIPKSILKQAKAEDKLSFVKKELAVNKEYKNRTAWVRGFEKYAEGDFGIDVGDEVLIETTMKINEGTGKYEGKHFLNFTAKKIQLVNSSEDFEDEDETEEDVDSYDEEDDEDLD